MTSKQSALAGVKAPMESADDVAAACVALLHREARYLDRRDWDAWLDLYTEDAEFWIPMWDSEHELTSDPQSELSLMYYPDRSGLEDRVFRLRTDASSASKPLPRTCHLITNIEVEATPGGAEVLANWQTVSYRHKKTYSFTGYYEYGLVRGPRGQWCIARKKIVVINDLILDILDFYSV